MKTVVTALSAEAQALVPHMLELLAQAADCIYRAAQTHIYNDDEYSGEEIDNSTEAMMAKEMECLVKYFEECNKSAEAGYQELKRDSISIIEEFKYKVMRPRAEEIARVIFEKFEEAEPIEDEDEDEDDENEEYYPEIAWEKWGAKDVYKYVEEAGWVEHIFYSVDCAPDILKREILAALDGKIEQKVNESEGKN